VLRGTYDSLTLVVYGNLAGSIGPVRGDHDLDSQLPDLPREVSWRMEDLPEALQPQTAIPFAPLKHLQLIHLEKANTEVIMKVLKLTGQIAQFSLDTRSVHKVVKSLVYAAASLHISGNRLPTVALHHLGPAYSKSTTSEGPEEGKGFSLLLEAQNELCELLDSVEEKKEVKFEGETLTERMKQDEVADKSENLDAVLELILRWIKGSVRLADFQTSALLPVSNWRLFFFANLAASAITVSISIVPCLMASELL
jgi:hypothetical protein